MAVAWHIYSITHRAIDLGYTGLALFLPSLLFLLVAGHIADRFDRRRILLLFYGLQMVCALALVGLAHSGSQNVFPIYVVLFIVGTGRAFAGPAGTSLIPHLVPEKHFVNAITWGGAIFQFANVTGPAIGGLLFTLPLLRWFPGWGLEGAGIVYIFNVFTLFWFLVLVASLDTRPGRMEHRATSVKVILAGFQYVSRSPMLLGAISLDLFVMLLGGAVALMPIFAQEILRAGPVGLGMLRAAPAAGAVTMSLLMARFPLSPPRRAAPVCRGGHVWCGDGGLWTLAQHVDLAGGSRPFPVRQTRSASWCAARWCNWLRRRRCAAGSAPSTRFLSAHPMNWARSRADSPRSGGERFAPLSWAE